MYTQRQQECEDCNGEGEMINEAKRCKACKGKKVGIENKEITVDIEKGMTNGERITCHGIGHEVPGAEPGDLII